MRIKLNLDLAVDIFFRNKKCIISACLVQLRPFWEVTVFIARCSEPFLVWSKIHLIISYEHTSNRHKLARRTRWLFNFGKLATSRKFNDTTPLPLVTLSHNSALLKEGPRKSGNFAIRFRYLPHRTPESKDNCPLFSGIIKVYRSLKIRKERPLPNFLSPLNRKLPGKNTPIT